jgi:hypothetical protein
MPVIGASTTRLGAAIGPIISLRSEIAVVSGATASAYDLGVNLDCTQFNQLRLKGKRCTAQFWWMRILG